MLLLETKRFVARLQVPEVVLRGKYNEGNLKSLCGNMGTLVIQVQYSNR